jgi:hypothetical protein
MTALETAIARCEEIGAPRSADELDAVTIAFACSIDRYKDGDPRASVLLDVVRDSAPERYEPAATLGRELASRTGHPVTLSFALAAVAWACGMPAGSAAAISLIARSAGWIAHALEEYHRPTPYRLRLAYAGSAPLPSTPRRTLDAVRDYLSRS